MKVGECRPRAIGAERRRDLKRLAVQLAAMLPPDEDEATLVLVYARVLIHEFLGDHAHVDAGDDHRLAVISGGKPR